MKPEILAEAADWIAEQLAMEFGGFISAELVEGMMEIEQNIRDEQNNQDIDHETMQDLIFKHLTEVEKVPTGFAGMNPQLVREVLYWEDEFLALAGEPRKNL